MSSSRVGQVWAGVFQEDEGDVCLCVESFELNGVTRHRWVDLETGERGTTRETDHWEGLPDRRRVA